MTQLSVSPGAEQIDIERARAALRLLRQHSVTGVISYDDASGLRITIRLVPDAPYGILGTVQLAGDSLVLPGLSEALERALRADVVAEEVIRSFPEQMLVVTMPDRSRWAIPARVIAEWRAAYYADHDAARGDGDYVEIYAQELEIGLRDSSLLLDYAHNSTDWPDVVPYAQRLPNEPEPPVDYRRAWSNAHKEVVLTSTVSGLVGMKAKLE